MESEIIKTTVTPLKDLLPEIYGDTLKPGMKAVGHAIGDALEMCLLPITTLGYIPKLAKLALNKHLHTFAEKLLTSVTMQRKQFFCVLFTTLLLGLPLPLSAQYRSIVTVETVTVESPVGNAPRLPSQVGVKYADGKGEYRQVRWLNASNATEMAEANPAINPVGTE